MVQSAVAQSSDGVSFNFFDTSESEFTPRGSVASIDQFVSSHSGWNEGFQISIYAGMEGSKQPQDFGVNANLGGRVEVDASGPIYRPAGLGFQIGTSFVAAVNAVQVFELLGESNDSTQSYTTIGVFQRMDNGMSWGVVYDFLFQDSYDSFELGQWRIRLSKEIGHLYEVGATVNIRDKSDDGNFNSTAVRIEPLEQFSIYGRRYWESGTYTSVWLGQAAGHSEDNAVVGAQPRKENTLLFGADIYAPLNSWLAVYGEANVLTPVDTGAVNAYLGVEISTTRLTYNIRNVRYRNVLPVASGASFTNDFRLR